MTCGCLLVVTTGRACGSVHRLETQLSTALDPGDTATINHTGDPSLRELLGRLGTQEMWDKELLSVGTSWRGWGNLRFELSSVRKEAAERRVHKAEGTASARAPRWRQPGAEMRGWEEHKAGEERKSGNLDGTGPDTQAKRDGLTLGGTGKPRQDFEQGWDMISITVCIESDLRGCPWWCSG